MFKKMDVKSYLIKSFEVIIVFAAIIAAVGVIGLLTIEANSNTLTNKIEVADKAVKVCAQQANIAGRYVREMALSEDKTKYEDYKSKIVESTAIIEEQVALFKESHGTKDGLADEYEKAFDDWFVIAQNAMDELENGNVDNAKKILLENCSPSLENLLAITAQIEDKIETQKNAQILKGKILGGVFITLMIIMFALVFVFSRKIAKRVSESVEEAIGEMSIAVNELSKGNLSTVVTYEAENEFGELAKGLNFCFAELKKYVDAISNAMKEFAEGNLAVENDIRFIGDFENIETSIDNFLDKINEALRSVDEAANDVNGGADQIAAASQDLAEGACDQSASVQEFSATIADMSGKINSTAEYMIEIQNMMKNTTNTVDCSNSKMQDMKTAMNEIAVKSEQIKDIIRTIDEITSQTSLLALNASIEAARAGESGRGFAVVANEVSSLAKQSSVAAKNIAELIGETMEAVQNGTIKVDETAEVLDEIVAQSSEIMKKVEEVSEVARDEAEGMNQLTEGLDQISGVIQNNSASSEETAAASQELSANAQTMAELLTTFKLKEN